MCGVVEHDGRVVEGCFNITERMGQAGWSMGSSHVSIQILFLVEPKCDIELSVSLTVSDPLSEMQIMCLLRFQMKQIQEIMARGDRRQELLRRRLRIYVAGG